MTRCCEDTASRSNRPRLLIIKPSSLGDIVHGLQLAHSIRSQMPAVEIDWVAREVFAPLVELCPVVDRVIVFERRGGPAAFLRLLKRIRQRRYDVVLDLQGLARSGLMTAAARAERKLGRSDAREGARLACHESAPLPPAGRRSHALDILLRFCPLLDLQPILARPLPFRTSGPGPEPILPLEARKPAPVVLFPGSRRPEKEWKGFSELTRLLLQRQPQVRVVWAGSEKMAAGKHDDGRFFNLTGKTSLPALVPLIAGARVVVANDSGPMHLAAALGVPTVALFGPTPPELYGPYPLDDPRHIVVRAPGGDLARLTAETVYARVSRAAVR